MFLEISPIFVNILIDVAIFLFVLVLIIAVGSFFIIKDLQKEYKKVYRINSKFEIELRKLVNLMYKILSDEALKPYHDVVIKQLPHEEKRNLLKRIDEVFTQVETDNPDHNYIQETYENLLELKRVRDSKIMIFNQKVGMFPFNVYFKLMKIETFFTFTDIEK
jgi:uncharacterized protein YneF (UPF0154 family)